jgi:hypothetical protein
MVNQTSLLQITACAPTLYAMQDRLEALADLHTRVAAVHLPLIFVASPQ